MRIVVVSTYPPRRCGLATFTDDLRTALRQAQPAWDVSVCALDRDGSAYGPEVLTVVGQDDPDDYRRAARTMAAAGTDLVVIEHEYGIFGGPEGAYVLELADELRLRGVPYVVTLHTVLARPSRGQRATLAAVCAWAARVTVFTEDGRRLAAQTRLADLERLVVVPHGAPPVLREPAGNRKANGIVGRCLAELGNARIMATFGLISPGKGLDDGMAAMAALATRHPDLRYVIAGATHPEEVRRFGETYREKLATLADELGVTDRVHILDAYLTESELGALLARTDLFLTPYKSPDQICSGALTFAIAAGRPVVSTAYRYAVEMLAPRGGAAPGAVVPCGDVDAIAAAVDGLLADPAALAAAREAADALGATLTWPAVATRFAEVFAAAATARRPTIPPARAPIPPASGRLSVRLDQLDRLTDEIGIIQFANGTDPDLESGYCVDDVARLAMVAVGMAGMGPPARDRSTRWLRSSLRFLDAALAPDGMHNMLGYDGSWRDRPHLGDHVGRAIWALGIVAGDTAVGNDSRAQAYRLLRETLPLLAATPWLRTQAYAVLGLAACGTGNGIEPVLRRAGGMLAAAVDVEADPPWFEPMLTYDNARLPQALLSAGYRLGDPAMIASGLSTLDWYLSQVGLAQPERAVLRLVGNTWRPSNADGPAAEEGDEQPLDAAAVVEALVAAWRTSRRRRYADLARRAFGWFHGINRAGLSLYDPGSGGCRDGLATTYANPNQGAESTLAYYQAMLALRGAGLIEPVAVTQPRRLTAPPVHAGVRLTELRLPRRTGSRSSSR